MRGQITYFSDGDKSGEIKGADGQRYAFTLDDLLYENTLRYLARVQFKVRDGRAVAVDVLGDDGLSIGGGPEGIMDNLSMWGFFKRAMSRKYFDFEGRARRKEYWSFTLFGQLFTLLTFVVGIWFIKQGYSRLFPDGNSDEVVVRVMLSLLFIVFAIPSLSVLVRRLHDLNLPGWMILISFVPIIGGLILLVMTLWPGSEGRNSYGPAPLHKKRRAEESFDL